MRYTQLKLIISQIHTVGVYIKDILGLISAVGTQKILSARGVVSQFREKLFYLLLWRAILVALFALVLSATRCLDLRGALLTAANVALLFSLGLIVWSGLVGR